MKAVVFDIEHFATKDGPGIRTAVFLKGCPLRCMWCHNPESWSPQIERYPDGTAVGKEMSVDETLAEVLKDKPFYETSGGGLTVTGGEPLHRWEFVRALCKGAKSAGVRTAIETSGYATPAVIEALAPVVDLWLYDIKGMDPTKHKEHVGVDNTAILRNLRWLDAREAKIILRCPMIPGVNDFGTNLSALGRLANELKNVRSIEIEPYVPYGIDKAHKLGLKLYEAPRAAPGYAERIVSALSRITSKPVSVG